MKPPLLFAALFVPIASLLVPVAALAETPSVSDGRYVMGTVLEMRVEGLEAAAARPLLEDLFAEVSRLEAIVTTWDDASALSRLNRTAASGPQRVPPELAEVLRISLDGWRLTAGTFDVTVGPLVELWRRASETGAAPTAEELAAARARVGSDKVRIGEDGRVSFDRDGVAIELGGVAKGWALDRLLPRLREARVPAALLNFGQSSTWAVGAPPGSPGWRLIARGPNEDLIGILTLRDLALSVSGSLGQWVEIDGTRYGHVLDPRSGSFMTRRRQALVVAPNAALAEILSKALLLLGEREGVALVDAQEGCEGLLADADGAVYETPGFRDAVDFQPM